MAAITPLYIDATSGRMKSGSATDQLSTGRFHANGLAGIGLEMSNSRIVDVADPIADTDAANRRYVDNTIEGFHVKAPVRVVYTGSSFNTSGGAPKVVDGVTLLVGDRVLVISMGGSISTPAAENGIYVVGQVGTGIDGSWDRAEDFANGSAQKSGTYVFVQDGVLNGDTAWVITTDVAITAGSTPFAFVQFSGMGQLVAGAGLTKTGNTVDVAAGNGIGVGNDVVEINLSGTPGLTFNASFGNTLEVKANAAKAMVVETAGIGVNVRAAGAATGGLQVSSNALEIKADTARGVTLTAAGVGVLVRAAATDVGGLQVSASGLEILEAPNGGIQLTAAGVEVKVVSAARLSKAAAGLDVVGVPNLFQINGVATSANVTAANLNTLTSGASGVGLHYHSSQRVTPSVNSGEAIATGDVVYLNTTTDTIFRASNTTEAASMVLGLATAAVTSGAAVLDVHASGRLDGAITGGGFTPGDPVFLGTNGGKSTFAALASGANIIQLGVALNTTDLFVRIQDYGTKP